MPELYECLMQTIDKLRKENLKLVVFDTFRPWAVQKFMYETASDFLKPYIAPPPEENSIKRFSSKRNCYRLLSSK